MTKALKGAALVAIAAAGLAAAAWHFAGREALEPDLAAGGEGAGGTPVTAATPEPASAEAPAVETAESGAMPSETVATQIAAADPAPEPAEPAEAETASTAEPEPSTGATETAPAVADADGDGADVAAVDTGADPADEPAPEAATGDAGGPELAPAPAEASAVEGSSTADPAPAPEFDVVRVDALGEAVVAGRAVPEAEVELLVDGAVVATTVAGADGSFILLASLGQSDRARALQLRLARAGTAAHESAEQDGAIHVVEAMAPVESASGDAVAALEPTTEPDPALSEPAASGASGQEATEAASPDGAQPTETTAAAAVSDAAQSEAASTAEGGLPEPAIAGLSAPVVLLPTGDAEAAPVIVQPSAERVSLLQPAPTATDRVVLDRVTYRPGGDAIASGRGTPGRAVRAYANGAFVADAPIGDGGDWTVTLPRAVAEPAELLRFDEIGGDGTVRSRIEARFSYDASQEVQEVRRRRIMVQRGDNLWRIAEQHYGEGLRYSVIFSANSGLIRDADLIYPGQVFDIPDLIGGN